MFQQLPCRLALLIKMAAMPLHKGDKRDDVVIPTSGCITGSSFELGFETSGALIEDQRPGI